MNNKTTYIVVVLVCIFASFSVGFFVSRFQPKDDVIDNSISGNNIEKESMSDGKLMLLASSLYNNYINFDERESMHEDAKNINNSLDYMTSLAILDLIKMGKIDVTYSNCGDDGYSVVDAKGINNYIKGMFNLSNDVDFTKIASTYDTKINDVDVTGEADFGFGGVSRYPHLYMHSRDLMAGYRSLKNDFLLSYCLNKTNADSDKYYTKVTKVEYNDDKIYIYDDYFRVVIVNDYAYVSDRNYVENINSRYECSSSSCLSELGRNPYNYVVKNLSKYVGHYKHTFSKDTSGNYYWSSTEMVK